MKFATRSAILLTMASFAATPAFADDRDGFDSREDGPLTLAVFGDWPYSPELLKNANLLVNSINGDPRVSLVVHVGDLHSGSMACTSAGILPPIATANPGWNQAVHYQFEQFQDPVVYTPGDNEWADCHKSKQFSSGAPLKELASVRQLFFPNAGKTMGINEKRVSSQALRFDPTHPEDAQFVENVMWQDGRVQFVTLNIPGGSNNDTAPWSGIFSDPTAQAKEVVERSDADLRWLDKAFENADETRAKAVVVVVQADMWDTEAPLDQYTQFVQRLADLSEAFDKPVLLLNGDSHAFVYDQPLADPSSAKGLIHNTQAVSNLTRITVQGALNAPSEWLKLTIDLRKPQPFSYVRVPYCANPTSATCN